MSSNRRQESEVLSKTKRVACPVCSAMLNCSSEVYPLQPLLESWRPVQFPQSVIRDLFEQASSTQLFQCPQCQFEIFLPQIIGTPGFYSELSKHEPSHYYEEDKWEFGEALKDLKKSDIILEMGCGSGSFLSKVRYFVSEAYGVETNEHAVNMARSQGLSVFQKENISEIKSGFDAIFGFHVLEHVANPVDFLKDMSCLVKPGGRIGLSVPNQDGPVKYIRPCIQNMPPHHATRWHVRTLRVLAKKLGFKIERVACEPLTVKNYYYYSNYWIDSILPKKLVENRFLHSIFPSILSRLFGLFFKVLSLIGIQSVRWLKGQGVYVLMSVPEREIV